jgi:hypothetical protein
MSEEEKKQEEGRPPKQQTESFPQKSVNGHSKMQGLFGLPL